MDLFKPRVWSATDITLTKLSTTLFGIAIGLALPKKFRRYAPLMLIGVAALDIRLILHYFRNDGKEAPFVPENEGRTPAGENL